MSVMANKRGPLKDEAHGLATGAVSSDKNAPKHSYKGAGASVRESSQPNGGLDKASGAKKGKKGGMY